MTQYDRTDLKESRQEGPGPKRVLTSRTSTNLIEKSGSRGGETELAVGGARMSQQLSRRVTDQSQTVQKKTFDYAGCV